MKKKILQWMKEDIEKGIVLAAQEFCERHGTSRPVLYKHYTSINELREMAGGSRDRKKFERISNEQLLSRIREFYQKYGKAPRYEEVSSASSISRRFKGWSKAIELAIGEERYFSRDRIKDLYLELSMEKQKLLSSHEFYSNTRVSNTHIKRYFGSWNDFRVEIGRGREVRKTINNREELKKLYLEVSRKLGRFNGAKSKEFEEHSGYSSGVLNRFGGIDELRKECGFQVVSRSRKYSKYGIEKALLEACNRKGRRLKLEEIAKDSTLPCVATILRYFKVTGMEEVWREIGME